MKKILTITIACAMLVAMTACGNNNTSSSSSAPETSSSSSMSTSTPEATLSAKYAEAINKALPKDVTDVIPNFDIDKYTVAVADVNTLTEISEGKFTGTDMEPLKAISAKLGDMLAATDESLMEETKTAITSVKAHLDAMVAGEKPELKDELKKSFEEAIMLAATDESLMEETKTAITSVKAHLDAMVAGEKPELKDELKKSFEEAIMYYNSKEAGIGGILLGSLTYGENKSLSADDVEALVVNASGMNIKAHSVLIAKPKAGREADVKSAVENYMKGIQKSFENYLQDQYEIAKGAILETLPDGTVVLVMTENAQTVMDSIKSSLGA